MDRLLTRQDIINDIDKFGKPMVDKVREIIDYFKPQYYFIENPQTGQMKTYITDLPYYDVDYCKYSDWGYKKRTRIWTNVINFKPKICKKDCDNLIITSNQKTLIKNIKHATECSRNCNRLERYRIPPKLIEDLFNF